MPGPSVHVFGRRAAWWCVVNKRTGLNHPPVSVKRAVIARDGGFCLLALHNCHGEATTARDFAILLGAEVS